MRGHFAATPVKFLAKFLGFREGLGDCFWRKCSPSIAGGSLNVAIVSQQIKKIPDKKNEPHLVHRLCAQ